MAADSTVPLQYTAHMVSISTRLVTGCGADQVTRQKNYDAGSLGGYKGEWHPLTLTPLQVQHGISQA